MVCGIMSLGPRAALGGEHRPRHVANVSFDRVRQDEIGSSAELCGIIFSGLGVD